MIGRLSSWVVLFLVVAALSLVTSARTEARADTFSRHVVVAQEQSAADAGRDVLRRGGNAVDAAIATAFALAVTLPEAGNLGGGGFIVAYLADRREVVTVDFRELAPASATPTMYLGPDGKPARHRAGAWAAGVPGTVRGLGLAHSRFGKSKWADLVRPAARLAREGFAISADLAGSLNRQLARGNPGERPGRRGMTSVGWGISPNRPRRSANRITPRGAPATGWCNPTWLQHWTASPSTGPTSFTRAGQPG